MSASADVTQLLVAWSGGDRTALDRLLPIVYDDLSGIARMRLAREHPDHTLNTQALVHQSYINLVDRAQVGWRDRGHFFAVASRAMRRVLIDHARRRRSEKRGGGLTPLTLDEGIGATVDGLDLWLMIDEALTALEENDPRLARVVECRYFAGLSVPETAEALGISDRTVERDWKRARAYLKRALGD